MGETGRRHNAGRINAVNQDVVNGFPEPPLIDSHTASSITLGIHIDESRVFSSAAPRDAARSTAVVVLPTPPF